MGGLYGNLARKQEAEKADENEPKSAEIPQTNGGEDDKMTSNIDDKLVSKQDDIQIDLFAELRTIVRQDNKEVSPFRLSVAEKDNLVDILYELKRKYKLRTDQTEVTRIALAYVLSEFKTNKKDSILVAVLERLNA